MSVLSVRLFTDKVLHQSTELITNFNSEELFKLSQDMIETMFQYKGIGLAAPQVGVNKNLAVMHLENKSKLILVANCQNICYNKECKEGLEGCLSSPNISVKMKRFTEIKFDALNLLGDLVHYELSGFDAVIAQHEIFHLQGQMITDHIKKL